MLRPKCGGYKGQWELRVMAAQGGGCANGWVQAVVGAQGDGFKRWWVLRAVGAKATGAQGDGAGALPLAGDRLRALRVCGLQLGRRDALGQHPGGARWVTGMSRHQGHHGTGDKATPSLHVSPHR